MKRIILCAAALMAAASSYASLQFPYDIYQYFEGETEAECMAGWTVTGPNATPAASIRPYFSGYSSSRPYSLLTLNDGSTILATPCAFSDGTKSDSWLISPEFEVTEDSEILSYSVMVVGTTAAQSSTYTAYVSEGGTDPSDFRPLQEATLKGSQYGSNSVDKRAALTDLKGKKIRIALVNSGNSVGFMAFYKIEVGSWKFEFDNAAALNTIYYSDQPEISFNIKIATPATVSGQTIELYNESGLVQTIDPAKKTRLSMLTSVPVKFTGFNMSKDTENYTIKITPNYEGAAPLYIYGTLQKAPLTFTQTPVIEEATGSWCGWCVFGTAALNFAHDNYNSGDDKIILIAVHGGDDMEPSINDYANDFMAYTGISGYPTMAINRSFTESPVGYTKFNTLVGNKSFAKGVLKKITRYDDSNKLMATLESTLSFNTPANALSASIVVVEDGVTGTGSGYNQSNFASGSSWNQIKSQYGYTDEWQPYLEPFYNGAASIPAADMVYNHVGRGVYPSYLGVSLPTEMTANSPKTSWIEFEMPNTVKNVENTYAVLLITNKATGEIYAADEMPYADFELSAGINDTLTDASAISANIAGNVLNVNMPAAGEVSVMTVDGRVILNATADAGNNTYELNASGIVIVKVSAEGASKTLKLMAR